MKGVACVRVQVLLQFPNERGYSNTEVGKVRNDEPVIMTEVTCLYKGKVYLFSEFWKLQSMTNRPQCSGASYSDSPSSYREPVTELVAGMGKEKGHMSIPQSHSNAYSQ